MTRHLNPVVVIGSCLAVASGLLSYFATGRDLVLGVLVGINVQTLTIATEVLITIKTRDAKAGAIGKIMDQVEAISWMPKILAEICDSVTMIESRYNDTIAPTTIEKKFKSLQRELVQLVSGVFEVQCYDPKIKLDLLAGKASTLRTMSVQSHDLKWHLSPVGRQYWRAQQDALKRGWQVKRIFVYTEWTEQLQDLAEEQKRAGVIAKRILADSLPPDLQNIDITIWDTTHAFEHQKLLRGATVDQFTVNEEDIQQDFILKFERLENAAEDV